MISPLERFSLLEPTPAAKYFKSFQGSNSLFVVKHRICSLQVFFLCNCHDDDSFISGGNGRSNTFWGCFTLGADKFQAEMLVLLANNHCPICFTSTKQSLSYLNSTEKCGSIGGILSSCLPGVSESILDCKALLYNVRFSLMYVPTYAMYFRRSLSFDWSMCFVQFAKSQVFRKALLVRIRFVSRTFQGLMDSNNSSQP